MPCTVDCKLQFVQSLSASSASPPEGCLYVSFVTEASHNYAQKMMHLKRTKLLSQVM